MRCLFAVVVILFCAGSSALAVTIATVPVGNAGNAGEVQSQGTFGAVAYSYRIGTYEVTVGQYTEFLNAVAATDTYFLYYESMATTPIIAGVARSGSSDNYTYSVIGSANKPITHVSWGDAARFSNWLHNGQPTGLQDASTTEDGAYTLNGAITDAPLKAVSRNLSATWFIPTENEWYKAAFHKNDGVTGNYWDYQYSSDSVPFSDQPPGGDAPTQWNTANFVKDDGIANGYDDGYAVSGSTSFPSGNALTDVGAYTFSTSPYVTYGQGGNVREWNETVSGFRRVVRGSAWNRLSASMLASVKYDVRPASSGYDLGFRVATIPEPSTLALAAFGFVALAAWGWRRKR